MPYHATLCHATRCRATPRHTTPCHAKPRHAKQKCYLNRCPKRLATPRRATPCCAKPRCAAPRYAERLIAGHARGTPKIATFAPRVESIFADVAEYKKKRYEEIGKLLTEKQADLLEHANFTGAM